MDLSGLLVNHRLSLSSLLDDILASHTVAVVVCLPELALFPKSCSFFALLLAWIREIDSVHLVLSSKMCSKETQHESVSHTSILPFYDIGIWCLVNGLTN